MTRLKLPAYGKNLLLERRNGRHALEVALVYGDRWRERTYPRVCIMPDQYEPGIYDFRMLAGVRVAVLDQLMAFEDLDDTGTPPVFGVFFDLLAELANVAAFVEVEWPREAKLPMREVSEIAHSFRWADPATKRFQWPRWWNDDLDRDYRARLPGWVDDRIALSQTITERECGQAA